VPIIDFAILSIGAVTVPIYETSSAEQISFVLSDSGAVVAFAETDGHADKIEELKGDYRSCARSSGSMESVRPHSRSWPTQARPQTRPS